MLVLFCLGPLAETLAARPLAGVRVKRRAVRIVLWALAIGAILSIANRPASAQSEGSNSAAATEESGSILNQLLPADVIHLMNQDGVPVPVPRDATLDQFLQWLREKNSKPPALPAPSVASVQLTGTADDERAIMAATFVIQNEHADDFAVIPLGLHEAVIRRVRHEGPGEFQFQSNDRAQGSMWWIRGAGRHTVSVELSVPVKRQGPSRRLQLTLPDAATSRIDLATIFRGVTVRSTTGEFQAITPEKQTSRMEGLGFGAKLDLTWQPIVAESPTAPVLEADTTIMVHASTESLLMEAYQRLSVLQGTVSEVAVRLPPNAELLSIEGRDYGAHRSVADDPSRVLVQLASPGNGQIQLKWTIRMPAAEDRRFTLEGFQVEQARKQGGQIGLIPIEGLRMAVANADHPHLMRIDATELAPLSASARVSRAYRYFSQPFRMVLSAETIEPYFTVEPRFTLSVRLDEATLEGVFAVKVLRGNLRQIELDWQNWKSDGWTIEAVEPQGEVIEGVDQQWENRAERMRVRLVEDLGDQFAIRLRSRRMLRPEESATVSMPRVVSRDSAAVPLRLIEADNLSCELTPIGETVVDLQVSPSGGGTADPVVQPGRVRNYRIASGEQLISLKAVKQERRVQASSSTLLELAGSRLRCVQSLQFNVEHERLAEFRVTAPRSLRQASLRFLMDANRTLQANWQDDATSETSIATVTFPEPRLGQFTIQAEFEIPLSDDVLTGDALVDVPILSCTDYTFQQIELQATPEIAPLIAMADAGWKPRTNVPGRASWLSGGSASSARIRFESGGGSQTALITAAKYYSEWDRKGSARCIARFRMSGWFMRLGLILPADATSVQTAWDDQPLSNPEYLATETRPTQYTLRVRSSGADDESHWLTVHYRLPAKQQFGLWNRWTFVAPQIAQAKWIAESRWEIRFPDDQHLFTFSDTMTPQFQWERQGIVWKRISSEPPASDRQFADTPVNRYAFLQFGEPQGFQFATMSGPMILFIGASISLASCFLLLRLPQLRSLLAVWMAVFALALAGLWFRRQLEVLLQPMLIGLAFPLAAVWLQGLRRHDTSAVLSFDPLLELSEPRSSVATARYSPEAQMQEPVLVRSPSGSTHDFLRTGASSGVP